MTALIARRDALTLRLSVLRDFANEASALVNRHSASEIKIRSAVDVRELRAELDEKSKELRELNTKIQSINWTAEL
jgi:seryl-tRNA synthetase